VTARTGDAGTTRPGGRARTMPPMSTDDLDPSADTAMFRAYVDRPTEPTAPASNRSLLIALAAAIVVLAVLAIVLLAA
jgi:hypothetical protein